MAAISLVTAVAINTIRFVEEHVLDDAKIGLGLEENDFRFPYFGPRLSRTVTVVDVGDAVPPSVDWLVIAPGRPFTGCGSAWRRERHGRRGWEVWRRLTADEPCP